MIVGQFVERLLAEKHESETLQDTGQDSLKNSSDWSVQENQIPFRLAIHLESIIIGAMVQSMWSYGCLENAEQHGSTVRSQPVDVVHVLIRYWPIFRVINSLPARTRRAIIRTVPCNI